MPMTLRRSLQFALAFVASGYAVSQVLPQTKAEEVGWITLFDGKDLEQWDQVGKSNWHLADGTVIADKMDGKEAGYLVSKKSYKDFVLRVEFWPSDDANSGIYFRCLDAMKITDRTCYEANIFDQRPDPSYGTGAITRYVEINPMPKAGGKWNTFEITAKGRDITIVLDGAGRAIDRQLAASLEENRETQQAQQQLELKAAFEGEEARGGFDGEHDDGELDDQGCRSQSSQQADGQRNAADELDDADEIRPSDRVSRSRSFAALLSAN